jgi:hypothetical protein
MKSANEHRVPLTKEALAVLDRMRGLDSEFIFPCQNRGKGLSNMAMTQLMCRIDRGGVIGAAMVVNLLVPGMAGILIPIGLDRLGADPALASGTFVTTVTDVVGFFVFLGLAAVVLL